VSKIGRAITSYLERQGWDVEQDGDEEIFTFAWQGVGQQYHTIISVTPFGEPAMYAIMIRSMLPVEASKAHVPKLLDLMNRINVAFPYGNFVLDTISESYALMAETQLFLPNDSLNQPLFEQVLDASMEMAEFYQPAFDGVVTKKMTIDQALDLVLQDEALLDEIEETTAKSAPRNAPDRPEQPAPPKRGKRANR
jgi:hypothetical protein